MKANKQYENISYSSQERSIQKLFARTFLCSAIMASSMP